MVKLTAFENLSSILEEAGKETGKRLNSLEEISDELSELREILHKAWQTPIDFRSPISKRIQELSDSVRAKGNSHQEKFSDRLCQTDPFQEEDDLYGELDDLQEESRYKEAHSGLHPVSGRAFYPKRINTTSTSTVDTHLGASPLPGTDFVSIDKGKRLCDKREKFLREYLSRFPENFPLHDIPQIFQSKNYPKFLELQDVWTQLSLCARDDFEYFCYFLEEMKKHDPKTPFEEYREKICNTSSKEFLAYSCSYDIQTFINSYSAFDCIIHDMKELLMQENFSSEGAEIVLIKAKNWVNGIFQMPDLFPEEVNTLLQGEEIGSDFRPYSLSKSSKQQKLGEGNDPSISSSSFTPPSKVDKKKEEGGVKKHWCEIRLPENTSFEVKEAVSTIINEVYSLSLLLADEKKLEENSEHIKETLDSFFSQSPIYLELAKEMAIESSAMNNYYKVWAFYLGKLNKVKSLLRKEGCKEEFISSICNAVETGIDTVKKSVDEAVKEEKEDASPGRRREKRKDFTPTMEGSYSQSFPNAHMVRGKNLCEDAKRELQKKRLNSTNVQEKMELAYEMKEKFTQDLFTSIERFEAYEEWMNHAREIVENHMREISPKVERLFDKKKSKNILELYQQFFFGMIDRVGTLGFQLGYFNPEFDTFLSIKDLERKSQERQLPKLEARIKELEEAKANFAIEEKKRLQQEMNELKEDIALQIESSEKIAAEIETNDIEGKIAEINAEISKAEKRLKEIKDAIHDLYQKKMGKGKSGKSQGKSGLNQNQKNLLQKLQKEQSVLSGELPHKKELLKKYEELQKEENAKLHHQETTISDLQQKIDAVQNQLSELE